MENLGGGQTTLFQYSWLILEITTGSSSVPIEKYGNIERFYCISQIFEYGLQRYPFVVRYLIISVFKLLSPFGQFLLTNETRDFNFI